MTESAPLTLVADLDTGIDDALALLWLAALHRAGAIDLHVTTSAGNTTVEQATRNSAEVLRIAGATEVPVTAGAARPRILPLTTTPETHGPAGLGYWVPQLSMPGEVGQAGQGRRAEYVGQAGHVGKEEQGRQAGHVSQSRESTADNALAAWASASPDLILVAGPATNLARVVECAPELLRNTQVTVMGGAFLYPGNTTPTAEWNAWSDPHALAFCLDHWPSDAPLPVMCPLNVTEQVVLTPERLGEWVAALPEEQGAFLEAALRFYMEFHESVGAGYSAQIHDLAAAMVLCGAVDMELRDATVQVEVGSTVLRGTTVADWSGGTAQGDRLLGGKGGGVGPYWRRPANARILTALDPEQVFARFAEAVLPEPPEPVGLPDGK